LLLGVTGALVPIGGLACGIEDEVTVDRRPLNPRVLVFGGVGSADDVRGMHKSGSGSVALIGTYEAVANFGSTVLEAEDASDPFIVMVGPAGTVSWAQAIRTGNMDEANVFSDVEVGGNDLHVGSGGEIIVGVEFRDQVEFVGETLSDAEGPGIAVVKLNGLGDVIWSRIGRGLFPRVNALAVSPWNREVSVVGRFFEGATFGTISVDSDFPESEQGLWVRYDQDGSVRSADVLTSAAVASVSRSTLLDIWISGEGHAYSAGEFTGGLALVDEDSVMSSTRQDVVVVASERFGRTRWAKQIGGESDQEAVAIDGVEFDELDGRSSVSLYVAARNSSGADVVVDDRVGSGETLVLKLSAEDGKALWIRSSDGTIVDIGVTRGGEVIAVGYFRGSVNFDGLLLTSPSSFDTGFIVKYSSAGRPLWARMIPGRGPVRCREVEVTPLGEVLVAGTFDTAATFGVVEKVGFGGQDVFLLRLGPDGSW